MSKIIEDIIKITIHDELKRLIISHFAENYFRKSRFTASREITIQKKNSHFTGKNTAFTNHKNTLTALSDGNNGMLRRAWYEMYGAPLLPYHECSYQLEAL